MDGFEDGMYVRHLPDLKKKKIPPPAFVKISWLYELSE